MNKNARGDIVSEYSKKYRSTSTRLLAKMLFQEFPDLFADEEKARGMIRYYRGQSGVRHRQGIAEESLTPFISLPASIVHDPSPYVIQKDLWPIVAIGDVHIPFHDEDALEIALARAVEINAKCILLAGDWMDMYMVSRFQKDPRMRNPREEIEMFHQILQEIRRVLPNAKLIFKVGNHEKRFNDYIMANAPMLFGMEGFDLKAALKLDELGIDYVDSMRVMKFRSLSIIHGHEYVFAISNPVNPARGLFTRAKKSALCFHHHRTSEHTETDISGQVITTWSSGCMCHLQPEYMPLNNWNLGFVEIYGNDESDNYYVDNRRIINYQLM